MRSARIRVALTMATTDYATFQKVDENNEVIIAEAVCDRTKVCMRVCCIFYAIAVLSFLIFAPCALVLGVFLGRKAAVEWRLYLTSTGLHYTRVGACTCVSQVLFIPLSDIEDVFVQESILIQNGWASSRGHIMKITINRNKIAKYLPWWQRIVVLTDYMEIANVANASDFAAAIRREIARS